MGGTGTGGIITLGLGSRISIEDIIKIFTTRNLELFPTPRWGATTQFMHGYLHENAPSELLMKELFQNSTMASLDSSFKVRMLCK